MSARYCQQKAITETSHKSRGLFFTLGKMAIFGMNQAMNSMKRKKDQIMKNLRKESSNKYLPYPFSLLQTLKFLKVG